MTTTAAIPSAPLSIDETRVESFVGQLLTDFAGAASTAMTVIGDRLGLYRAMTGAGPLSPAGLAAAAGVNERLVTEWLAAQTVSGYVIHSPEAGTYELAAEHAVVLSLPDSPAYVVAAAEIIASQYLTLDHLEDAFRRDTASTTATSPRPFTAEPSATSGPPSTTNLPTPGSRPWTAWWSDSRPGPGSPMSGAVTASALC